MNILGFGGRERAVKRALTQALELERARIGAEQAAVIEDFLHHGEFGLAREQLEDVLSDRELAPSDETTKLLDEAKQTMRASG
jgi:hypothetical protein